MDVEGEGEGEGGVWEDGEEGEEVNRSHSDKHVREISHCCQCSNDCPHPLSFRFIFSSASPLEGIRVKLSFERGNPARMRQLMCLCPD